jgi:thioredoxin reductase (NADPH)
MPFFTYVARAANGSAEGAIDPSDPMAREAQTFPQLAAEMIERVARYGSEERFATGAAIFSRGDRSVDFFVVLGGSIEIFDVDEHDQPQVFAILRERQFAGELDLFNDRQVLVSARAGADSHLLRIKRADFRRLVSSEADIGEIVMRAFILRRVGLIRHQHGAVVVVGPAHSAATLRLVQFLSRNAYPHRLLDTERDAEAAGFLDCFSLNTADLPVVIAPGHHVLRNPSLPQMADDLGLTEAFDHAKVFDLAVVGAGPAGLAAAVYGASEGLQTIVVESMAPGGQAGTSSKIENYLGFPTGISGQALAGRAQVQAQKFGARLALSRAVVGLECDEAPYAPAPSSSRLARAIASSTSPTTSGSRAPASTTRPRRWRRACARARKCWSSAAATRPGRRRSFSPARSGTSTCWCAVGAWRRRCPTTWCSGSSATSGSACIRTRR